MAGVVETERKLHKQSLRALLHPCRACLHAIMLGRRGKMAQSMVAKQTQHYVVGFKLCTPI